MPLFHPPRARRTIRCAAAALMVVLATPPWAQYSPLLEATTRLADAPRPVWLHNSPTVARKLQTTPGRHSFRLSNPYLDPQRGLISQPADLSCRADGSLMVAASGGFDREGRTTVSGWWQVQPDGAVKPWNLNPHEARGSSAPQCNAPLRATPTGAERFVLRNDGDLLLLMSNAVLRLTSGGELQMYAGPARMCREYLRGLNQVVDGPADEVRFSNGNQAPAGAVDGEGNLWISDRGFSLLRRVAPDGSTRTLIGEDRTGGPKLAPEDMIRFFHMAWDATRGEMVVGGYAQTPSQVYTTVWRIKPDGSARRVLLGHKLGRSAAGIQLDGVQGLAVDGQGRIVFASRNMASDAVALFRVDEAKGTAVQLTGHRLPTPASPIDGAHDGPADKAYFNRIQRICASGDGTVFIHDDILIRKLDTREQVSTWLF